MRSLCATTSIVVYGAAANLFKPIRRCYWGYHTTGDLCRSLFQAWWASEGHAYPAICWQCSLVFLLKISGLSYAYLQLPYRVRWQDLKDLFRRAGTVLRADVSLGPDNRSRGYGTVLLATAEDAGRAVDTFNGYSWQSRMLEVRLDRQLQEFESPTPINSSYLSLLFSASKSSSVTDDPDYLSSVTDPNSRRNLFVGNVRVLFCFLASSF